MAPVVGTKISSSSSLTIVAQTPFGKIARLSSASSTWLCQTVGAPYCLSKVNSSFWYVPCFVTATIEQNLLPALPASTRNPSSSLILTCTTASLPNGTIRNIAPIASNTPKPSNQRVEFTIAPHVLLTEATVLWPKVWATSSESPCSVTAN